MHAQLPVALAVFAALTEPGLAGAQSATPAPAETGQTYAPQESLERLLPGDKIIARALFADQLASPRAASAGLWSLQEIAGRKAKGYGWGEIFTRMKAAGLLRARTLGLVVSRHHRESPAHAPAFATPTWRGHAGSLVGAEKSASVQAAGGHSPNESMLPTRTSQFGADARAASKRHQAGGLETPSGSPGASIDPGAVLPGIHLIHCSEDKASVKAP